MMSHSGLHAALINKLEQVKVSPKILSKEYKAINTIYLTVGPLLHTKASSGPCVCELEPN